MVPWSIRFISILSRGEAFLLQETRCLPLTKQVQAIGKKQQEVGFLNIKDFEQAALRLKDVIHHIPISTSRTFSEISGSELYLKYENQQKTGSFKVRGAYNKIAALIERGEKPEMVIASSAGNHAQGVAFAAKSLGIKSTIVMPRSTPIAKVSATEGYGANVVLSGDCYDDSYQKALSIQKKTGAVFIHPFDDLDVIAGQGTIGLEILRELPGVDAVLVPAGGGGLLSGVACCIKEINPRIQVIGVQAEGASALVESFKAKSWQSTDSVHTIADGIAVKSPGKTTTDMINQYVDDMVTISDEEIASSILLLLERSKQMVEPAGAASLSAALAKKAGLKGKKVVCVLSGGNIDVSFIHRIVEKGLVNRGRQMKFKTLMLDMPGSLQLFSKIVAEFGGNIIKISHDRLDATLRIDEAILYTTCEVSGPEHGQEIIRRLAEHGFRSTIES